MHLMRIQAESILVTDDVHAQYVTWLNAQQRVPRPPAESLPLEDDTTPFTPPCCHTATRHAASGRSPTVKLDPTRTTRFPPWNTISPCSALTHVAFQLLERGLEASFFQRPFIQAFEAQIDADGIPFGMVKQWVQATCSDVPTPHRRELTFLVQPPFTGFLLCVPRPLRCIALTIGSAPKMIERHETHHCKILTSIEQTKVRFFLEPKKAQYIIQSRFFFVSQKGLLLLSAVLGGAAQTVAESFGISSVTAILSSCSSSSLLKRSGSFSGRCETRTLSLPVGLIGNIPQGSFLS